VASMEFALLLAAAASLLLTMLTVILGSVAAATSRNRLIGVLRILGMSPRQLRAVQAWELGPVAITAMVVGTALGLALPLIVTNALDLRPFVGGQLQPGPAIEPLWVLAAVGSFGIVVVLAGVVAAALGRRFAPAGTLKMGEG
ncbi:MAG: FtsX-like permease family protein, partial [Schumannella sp.]|nr:FtsX-like permease family protein [Schumannella sp.]